jgi:hypothetical protein
MSDSSGEDEDEHTSESDDEPEVDEHYDYPNLSPRKPRRSSAARRLARTMDKEDPTSKPNLSPLKPVQRNARGKRWKKRAWKKFPINMMKPTSLDKVHDEPDYPAHPVQHGVPTCDKIAVAPTNEPQHRAPSKLMYRTRRFKHPPPQGHPAEDIFEPTPFLVCLPFDAIQDRTEVMVFKEMFTNQGGQSTKFPQYLAKRYRGCLSQGDFSMFIVSTRPSIIHTTPVLGIHPLLEGGGTDELVYDAEWMREVIGTRRHQKRINGRHQQNHPQHYDEYGQWSITRLRKSRNTRAKQRRAKKRKATTSQSAPVPISVPICAYKPTSPPVPKDLRPYCMDDHHRGPRTRGLGTDPLCPQCKTFLEAVHHPDHPHHGPHTHEIGMGPSCSYCISFRSDEGMYPLQPSPSFDNVDPNPCYPREDPFPRQHDDGAALLFDKNRKPRLRSGRYQPYQCHIRVTRARDEVDQNRFATLPPGFFEFMPRMDQRHPAEVDQGYPRLAARTDPILSTIPEPRPETTAPRFICNLHSHLTFGDLDARPRYGRTRGDHGNTGITHDRKPRAALQWAATHTPTV